MAWDPYASLSAVQREKLHAYAALLRAYNQKLNLISRDTEGVIEERHILHSLALTYRAFPAGSAVVDWGTGGGLPAIPLAICNPGVTVYAVDSVGKKIHAVRAMARTLELDNLFPWHGRAAAWPDTATHSVSRATAPLTDLWNWHQRAWVPPSRKEPSGCWQAGLICLKGGDLTAEVDALRAAHPGVGVEALPLETLLGRPYFADKYLLQVGLTP